MRRLSYFLVLLAALGAGPAVSRSNPLHPMKDFFLLANFGPGEGHGKPWEVRIAADGRVEMNLFLSFNRYDPKVSRLSPETVRALQKEIGDQEFVSLKSRYAFMAATDGDVMTITVQEGDKSKTVTVYGLTPATENADMVKFSALWESIVQAVSPPAALDQPEPSPSPQKGRK